MSEHGHDMARQTTNSGITTHCHCGLAFFERFPRFRPSADEERETMRRADERYADHVKTELERER